MLLHGGNAPVNTVEVTYRVWRHRERAHAAFLADAEEQKRRGASITLNGFGKAEPEPAEYEQTVRIWRAGQRGRVEHHGGERDGYYAVTDGPLWWVWDERMGANSNQDDPSVGGQFRERAPDHAQPHPAAQFSALHPTEDSHVAGRPTITAQGTPRAAGPEP